MNSLDYVFKDPKKDFPFIVSFFRDTLNLTNEDIAIRFGTTEENIQKWIDGKILPSIQIKSIVCEWFIQKLLKNM